MSMFDFIMKHDQLIKELKGQMAHVYQELGLELGALLVGDVTVSIPAPEVKKVVRARANLRWSDEDIQKLESLTDQGVGNKEIARVLDRTVSSINSQLWKLRNPDKVGPR